MFVSVGACLVTIALSGDVSNHARETLRESCNTGLGAEECRLDSGVLEGGPSDALRANVVFSKDGVDVELLAPRSEGYARTLRFSLEDSEEQRAVAAGLLVAALAAKAEAERVEEPENPPETPAPKALTKLPSPPRTAERTGAFGVALEGVVFPRDAATPALVLGGGIRPYAVSRGGLFGVELSGRIFQGTETNLELSHLEGGVHFTLHPLASASRSVDLFVAGGAVLTHSFFAARVDGAVERAELSRVGGRLAVGVGYRLGAFEPYVAGEGLALGPSVTLRVAGEELREFSWFSGGFAAGVRVRFGTY